MIDIPAFIGLILKVVFTGIMIFACIKQADEVFTHERDSLSKLRLIILIVLTFAIIASVPGITYQAIRADGYESIILRNISTIASNLSLVGIGAFVLSIYTFKAKDEEKK